MRENKPLIVPTVTPVPPILTLYPTLTFSLWASNFSMILETRPIYMLFAAMIGRF